MNSFGLGLVLNFVDNATSGMTSATQVFNRMSATADSMAESVSASSTEMAAIAYSLNAVGDTFISVGSSITGVFSNITSQVVDAGMQMQGYRMQLSALYGSVEAGEQKIEEIKQYAMSSVFDIQSLIPAVTMMKAVGIEAMQEVTTSSGSATQKLLDYASDIAAMVPNMRNTYGTGVAAAMGALKEYIAEGNALTLKRGAGLDITGILGEDKGSTIEERTQQVADLVDKLNIVGYTANLAGTPTQRLSNMQDALFNSLTKIADSGVFEVYCGLLEKLSNWVFSLVENEETFNMITGVLADTITTILSPLESMLDWVIENSNAIIDWIKEHPKLTKYILLTVAAVGALLVVGGSLLKMLSTVAFAMSGLQMIKTLPSMLGMVGTAFKGLIAKMLPFVALASIVYFVWKNNLFGIRDTVTQVMGDLKEIFSLVGEAWGDNMLSEDSFLKAQKLGILPLIEGLLQLKYYWSYFTEGFKDGFRSFYDGIVKSLSWLKVFGIDVNGVAESVGNFLKKLVGIGSEDKWKAIGEAAGKIGALALSLFTVHKALSLVKGISSGASALGKIPILGGLFGGKGDSSTSTTNSKGLLSNPKEVLKSMLSLAVIVGGSVILITAVGALMKVPGFSSFLSKGARTLDRLFDSIIPIALGVGALGVLVAVLNKLKISPTTALKGIANVAIILGGFSVLIMAIGALNSIPGFSNFTTNGVSSIKALSGTMSVFSTPDFLLMIGAVAALGLVSIPVVLAGIAGLALVIAGLTLIVSAFGLLAKIPGINDFIKSGGETLALLFEQVGLAVGSLIGGFMEGITDSLPQMGENLSAFAENLKPFFSVVKDAPVEEVGLFLESFASSMLKLGAQELLTFFTGGIDLPALGLALTTFSTNAEGFFNTITNYPEGSIEKGEKVFKALGSIGGYAIKTGGVAQLFTGTTDLGEIGRQLADFAPNGLTFFNEVANYSEAGLDKSPKVFQAIAGIGDYDFKTGGVAQFFTGSTAIDTIGEQLASFAPNGLIYFNTVALYSEAGMEKSSKVFQAIAGIGDYDFKMGGMAQLFTGSTAFDEIGRQLADFAPHGSSFFNSVASYPLEGIQRSMLVFEALSSIGKYEFKSGGMAQLFTGSTDLGSMGKQLSKFGDKAKDFFSTAEKYSDVGLDRGTKAISLLSIIGSSDLKTGGLFGLFTGGYDLPGIGTQLALFGGTVSVYFRSVEGLSEQSILRGGQVINTLKALGDSTFKSGGLLQAFTGTVDITNLADNLSKFGIGSAVFFTTASTLPEGGFSKAVSLFESLSAMGNIAEVVLDFSDDELSHLGSELALFITNAKPFFVDAEGLSTKGVNNITEALGLFFDKVTAFDSSKLSTLATNMDSVGTSVNSLSDITGTAVTQITTNSEGIVSALTDCSKNSLDVLNDLSSKGASIGLSLMVSIASSISANAYMIREAVQNAVKSISVQIPDVANNAADQVRKYNNGSMVGLSTGGYVKTTGIAVLHPNEVVVNDDTTKRLRNFLNGYEESQIQANMSVVSNTTVVSNTPTTANVSVPALPQNSSESNAKSGETHNDYSVTFAQGSIVIQLTNGSDKDLEDTAEKLMKIIARKQQLRAMAVRN